MFEFLKNSTIRSYIKLDAYYFLIDSFLFYNHQTCYCLNSQIFYIAVPTYDFCFEIFSYFQELSAEDSVTTSKSKELFFSSDVCAIVEHTKNYLAIEDNEVVHIMVLFAFSILFWHNQ